VAEKTIVLAERAGKFAGKLAAEAQQGLMEAAHSAAQPLVKYGVHKVIGKYLPDRFYTQAKNWARKNAFEACFTAGTPLEFQYGAKAIELAKSFEEFGDDCDWIISRDEHDPEGALTVRRVLRKFVRLAPVLNLHVGGKIIGTTAEHPFRVKGKGWTPAQELRAGDEIRLMGPGWTTVEGVADSGLITTVYNLEIEGDHTYFVGCVEWGFSVWAHNASYAVAETLEAKANYDAIFGNKGSKKAQTLEQWLKDNPDLLAKAHDQFNINPQWQGIDPATTPVFYRSKADVDAIRAMPGESSGHHPHGLALGGPEGQTLTITGETRTMRNLDHNAATTLQRQIINVINGG